jgi:hypothetical protein
MMANTEINILYCWQKIGGESRSNTNIHVYYKYTKNSQMADGECHLSTSDCVPGHSMLSVTVDHLMESNIKFNLCSVVTFSILKLDGCTVK